ETVIRLDKTDDHQLAPNQIRGRAAELDVARSDASQFFSGIDARTRFLTRQYERRFVRGGLSRETRFRHGVEGRVIVGLISGSEIIDHVLRARRHLRSITPCCDGANLSEERSLLMEVTPLLRRQEQIDGIGVARGVMA